MYRQTDHHNQAMSEYTSMALASLNLYDWKDVRGIAFPGAGGQKRYNPRGVLG
jgi:hypothetical protein